MWYSTVLLNKTWNEMKKMARKMNKTKVRYITSYKNLHMHLHKYETMSSRSTNWRCLVHYGDVMLRYLRIRTMSSSRFSPLCQLDCMIGHFLLRECRENWLEFVWNMKCMKWKMRSRDSLSTEVSWGPFKNDVTGGRREGDQTNWWLMVTKGEKGTGKWWRHH